jgi:Fic family protein
MKPENFVKNAPGKLIKVDGVPGITHSFIPDPLPPKWKWPNDLYPLLMQANTSLARLDGVGKHLGDQTFLLRPLQNREAQLSSKLEGTITEPQKQLLFQMEPSTPSSDSDPINDLLEVFNYLFP